MDANDDHRRREIEIAFSSGPAPLHVVFPFLSLWGISMGLGSQAMVFNALSASAKQHPTYFPPNPGAISDGLAIVAYVFFGLGSLAYLAILIAYLFKFILAPHICIWEYRSTSRKNLIFNVIMAPQFLTLGAPPTISRNPAGLAVLTTIWGISLVAQVGLGVHHYGQWCFGLEERESPRWLVGGKGKEKRAEDHRGEDEDRSCRRRSPILPGNMPPSDFSVDFTDIFTIIPWGLLASSALSPLDLNRALALLAFGIGMVVTPLCYVLIVLGIRKLPASRTYASPTIFLLMGPFGVFSNAAARLSGGFTASLFPEILFWTACFIWIFCTWHLGPFGIYQGVKEPQGWAMVFPAASVQVVVSLYMIASGVPVPAFIAVTVFMVALPLGICLALVGSNVWLAINGKLRDPEADREWGKEEATWIRTDYTAVDLARGLSRRFLDTFRF